MTHVPVLLKETIDSLEIEVGDVIFDGTLGGGGHSEEIARRYGDSVRIIGTDLDAEAIAVTREKLLCRKTPFSLHNESFRKIDEVLRREGVRKVNKILLDLGLSSNQFEDSGRGFTFRKDEPLLMTFKAVPTEEDLTARAIVNTWAEESIADIIWGYGEERYARKIAKAIVEARGAKPIMTTFELVEIIKSATPRAYHFRKIHPATRTFQALRIAVNDELGSLREALSKGWIALAAKGRMAVISFHSLEDRIVKNFYREKIKEGTGNLINKKPITADAAELGANPRSRSAKLRTIEKSKIEIRSTKFETNTELNSN